MRREGNEVFWRMNLGLKGGKVNLACTPDSCMPGLVPSFKDLPFFSTQTQIKIGGLSPRDETHKQPEGLHLEAGGFTWKGVKLFLFIFGLPLGCPPSTLECSGYLL